MKLKKLVSALLGAFAFTGVQAASEGNTATETLEEAAKGFLVLPVSIELTKQLVFPDLVIPGAGSESLNTVSVSRVAGNNLSVLYSQYGNPAGPGTAEASSYSNLGGAAQLGEITVKGHEGMSVSISVARPSSAKTLADDGYTIEPSLDQYTVSGGKDETLSTGSSADVAEEGSFVIPFGGVLTANASAVQNKGVVYEDIDVTVSYR
ncbi:MAG: hypothetical protein ACPGSC_12950 [Granulosicoccaceae bacterium]